MTTRRTDPKETSCTHHSGTSNGKKMPLDRMFIAMVMLFSLFSVIFGYRRFSDALAQSLATDDGNPWRVNHRQINLDSFKIKKAHIEALPLEPDKVKFFYKACDACFRARVKERKRSCGVLMIGDTDFDVIQNVSNLIELQQSISNDFAVCNRSCHPKICAPKYVITADLVIAAPPIVKAISPNLPSIPAKHRLPTTQILPNGMKVKANYSDYNDYLYAMINPSIIPAPSDLKRHIDNAVYLVSFRITSEAPHFSEWGWVWLNFPVKNMLGIAAMDSNFEILADVVLDLNAVLPRAVAQDARLFEIDGVVYVSYMACLFPIAFKGPSDVSSIPTLSKELKFTVHPLAAGVSRITDMPREGKNYHFFRDTSGSLFIEIFPTRPHHTRLLTIRANNRTRGQNWSLFGSHEDIIADDDLPHSFVNPFRQEWNRGRGSACCSRLPKEYYKPLLPDQHPANAYDYLLFGIMHLKSTYRKRSQSRPNYVYVPQLYAFAPVSPFPAVAYSGLFCFEGVDEPSDDPYAIGTKNNNLILDGRSYPCPRIQFVSGMTDLVDDNSKVVVGYGVNDLFSRFVVVEKQYIADRLFRPFSTGLNDWRDQLK